LLARSNSVSLKRGAATGLEAIIYLQAEHLKPLGYFADVEARDNTGDENDPSGVYAVSYGGRDLDLPPSEDHDLLVAVPGRSSRTTQVTTTLATDI
jgi:hypothetical protein